MRKEILIIEDDKVQEKIFTKIISEISGSLKCEVSSTNRGIEAVEYIKKNKDIIKIVILDLSLPDLSGFQILEKIREIKKSIPVIILSADDDKDLVVETMKLGAVGYFVKGKGKKELENLYIKIAEIIEAS